MSYKSQNSMGQATVVSQNVTQVEQSFQILRVFKKLYEAEDIHLLELVMLEGLSSTLFSFLQTYVYIICYSKI